MESPPSVKRIQGNPNPTTEKTNVKVLMSSSNRPVPQKHDCGSTETMEWSARTEGPGTGFKILFTRGEEGRQTEVEFICDAFAGECSIVVVVPYYSHY